VAGPRQVGKTTLVEGVLASTELPSLDGASRHGGVRPCACPRSHLAGRRRRRARGRFSRAAGECVVGV